MNDLKDAFVGFVLGAAPVHEKKRQMVIRACFDKGFGFLGLGSAEAAPLGSEELLCEPATSPLEPALEGLDVGGVPAVRIPTGTRIPTAVVGAPPMQRALLEPPRSGGI